MGIPAHEREIAEKSVIVTTVHYNLDREGDKIRQAIALRFLQNASERNYRTVVVYGTVSDEFRKQAERLDTELVVDCGKGMGPSRRQGFARAGEYESAEVINWSEPEKDDYVRFISGVSEPIIEGKYGIVVPRRSESSKATYPWEQIELESIKNRAVRRSIKYYTGIDADLDITFGVRAWHHDHNNFFTGYDGRFGDTYDSINAPLINALAKGVRVGSITVDFEYPEDQRRSECIEGTNDLTPEMYMKRFKQVGETPVQIIKFLQSYKPNVF